MKKLLIATTALVATTGVAMAEVEISGLGRFGLDYNGGAGVGEASTQVNARLRFNIDASVDTDAGVTFGGRIRLQYDDGEAGGESRLSPGMLYATGNGFRMEVGNANQAMDSTALMYASEIGYLNRSFGNPIGNFYAFSTEPYGVAEEDRMGVFASYSLDGLNLRASYINPDQTADNLPVGVDSELSLSADYTMGAFTVSGAYTNNAGGNDGEDVFFLGAQYAVMPGANVGLLYFDNNDIAGVPGDDARRITLYGNYRVDAITYRGYIANDNDAGNATDTAYGLGIDYDLGGARLGADIHRNYQKDTIAGLGVRFDF